MRTSRRIALKIALAAVTTAGVVLLLLVLAGVFHKKVAAAAGTSDSEVGRYGRPLNSSDAVFEVTVRDLPQEEWAVGTVRAVHETTLGARLLATVTGVHVEAGQDVAADEILVELDDRDLRARLDRATAQVAAAEAARDQARADYDRISPLAAVGSASAFELTSATNALRAAEAEVQRAVQERHEAQTVLSFAVIRAPVAGRIIDKRVEVGDIVAPGQPLATLYDPTRLQLVASVRESLRRRLDIGQTVGVKLDVLDHVCDATVSEIVPEAATSSRSFEVKVTGPCPPGVYPGMFGRLRIMLGPRAAVCIPAAAVRQVGQLDTVEVAEQGRACRRLVQLGRTLGAEVEVLSGLAAGEQVVLSAPPPGGERR